MQMNRSIVIAAMAGLSLLAGTAHAGELVAPATQIAAASGQLERQTAIKLLRLVSIELNDHRLEDVVDYVRNVTGAEIEVHWIDDQHAVGLDPDQPITLRAKNVTALALLERAMEQAAVAFGEPGSNTWQFTDGRFEMGPKERLNAHTRIELYDINDLLFEVPEFADAPDFDLNTVLQSTGRGGGGGRSPFQGGNQQQDRERIPRDELAENIIDILTSLVETEQWQDNGGDAATVRFFQGHLLVNAPDYVHRGINGYRWWPSRLTKRIGRGETYRGTTLTSEDARKHRRDSELIDPRGPVRGEAARTDNADG